MVANRPKILSASVNGVASPKNRYQPLGEGSHLNIRPLPGSAFPISLKNWGQYDGVEVEAEHRLNTSAWLFGSTRGGSGSVIWLIDRHP